LYAPNIYIAINKNTLTLKHVLNKFNNQEVQNSEAKAATKQPIINPKTANKPNTMSKNNKGIKLNKFLTI